MTEAASVTVVVVMFNSAATIEKCLNSIPATCDVVVVDQCSTDDSVAAAIRARGDARLIKAGANRGFGAGCNLGAANARGDVVIFLNPDAYFSPGSVDVLAESVIANNALVGPRISDDSGEDQTRARNWSSVGSDLGEVCLPTAVTGRILRRDIPPGDPVYRSGGAVPYVQGACMALSAENFNRVGGFDERYFLYHEEEAISRKLADIGVRVILEPDAAITHIGGISTTQVRDFSAGQYYRSKALFYSTFHSTPGATAATFVLWLTLLAMAVTTPVRKLIGWRSEKGFSWYRSAAAGVVSGRFERMVVPPGRR